MKLKIILTLLFLTTALQSVEKETVKEKPQPSHQQIKVSNYTTVRLFDLNSNAKYITFRNIFYN